ncbi:energy-coupling factor transporter transmembrane component T family protein [Desulfoscipio geothermicus]|uniref:Energy-coupling factor transport system permease protein n=1 Tax=Desulfoscipio geothermicus DSM 3669 TaxID=1121426 RepID=A0A1I6D6Y8_9FIRM|nr:energy-coupling factor transporter transmembrane component T [Desulfoscipio geothermicus]SFR01210.1 energy-coupling factor transport system permease protein [Desulfoscipio geothermicus DSM 3669]
MLAYREKDNLIHKLHPLAAVAYISIIIILSLIFSHPVYLLGLLLAVGTVIIASGNFREWTPYLLISLGMITVIMLVNAVFVQAGSTVLFYGPRVPVLGKIRITLEAICFGIGMGIRLLVIVSAFCFYTYAVHPDKALKLFSKFGNKSVLAVTLSTRLFPLMIRDVRRITEVQRCRGVKLDTGSRWQRVKNRLPVINVLLLSSLERSLQLAESMQARGYGSGKRTCYTRDLWRPRDCLIFSAAVLSLLTGIWAVWQGWAGYTYYPRLESLQLNDLKMAAVIVLALTVPTVLSWGWKKWPLLKSKI